MELSANGISSDEEIATGQNELCCLIEGLLNFAKILDFAKIFVSYFRRK